MKLQPIGVCGSIMAHHWKTLVALIPTLVLTLIYGSIYVQPATSSTVGSDGSSVTNVVLVGALGDLAKKYLWQGLFDLYLAEKSAYHSFNMVAAGRKSSQEGTPLLSTVLDNHVSCQDSSPNFSPSCAAHLRAFKSSVKYHQLKTAQDYAQLCAKMGAEVKENGRLFYLSVPPFAYAGIAENIHKGCRPPNESNAWLRVVLEKPFGHDLQSAQELANQMSGFLKEEEIYRIDHYLGKVGVQNILPFRHLNEAKYGHLWNGDHIARVEIVMKETVDVKGRLEFYDSYGVIRDVMQNHLTEIMALIGLETPKNISSHRETLANKLRFLQQIKPIGKQQAVIGQYDGYTSQWRQELKKQPEESVTTPTFAGVSLFVNNPRWRDVPFVMTAGKALDERTGYVRVLFHDNAVCLRKRTKGHHSQCGTKQIIFLTGNPNQKYPSVLISKNLPKPEKLSSWTNSKIFPDELEIVGLPLKDFHYFSYSEDVSAYTALISSCYHGQKEKFVGTNDLTASWEIWTPLLNSLVGKEPRIYPSGEASGDYLNFQVSSQQRKVYFVHDVDAGWETVTRADSFSTLNTAAILDNYRSNPLVTGTKDEVVERLAVHLRNIAGESIHERGTFHLALSGGTTPRRLLAYLALRMNLEFPWHKTHIWLVDERCVSTTDERSNFGMLLDSLLNYIQIPHINVHPMPVELPSGLCNRTDRGPIIYESELKRKTSNGRLDYILLGMGSDGHTASLFSNHSSLGDSTNLVLLTDGGPPDQVPHRMTLSYTPINAARYAGVLISGKNKRPMVSLLKSEGIVDKRKYPITGVRLTDGELVWYIDHEALI